jgi:four helix bundle protein
MSQKLNSFRDLIVWQKSIMLVKKIYELTKKFPLEERYSLSSQMQRAAVSIPSNIAEGWMRKSSKSFIQFLRISLGSVGELETQTEIAKQEEYIDDVEYQETIRQIEEVRKMLYGTTASLNADC